MRKYKYYAIWSDNNHKFGNPKRSYSGMKIGFPDIMIEARNIYHADELIAIINNLMKEKDREELRQVLIEHGWEL